MNSVVLLGRLTRDPDIRKGEMCVAKFNFAVSRKMKKGTDFINCVAFAKTAELIEKYCVKGSQLCLEGRIQTGSYEKDNGDKVYTTDVIVESIEFIGSKADTGFSKVEDTDDLPFN